MPKTVRRISLFSRGQNGPEGPDFGIDDDDDDIK
jgi:hypothetical protein